MKEIIGVSHVRPEVRDAVIKYIDAHHPNLESIMIEMPQEWEKINIPFFTPMAQHYQSKGVRVIAGDTRHFEPLEMTPEEAIDLYSKDPFKYVLKEKWGIFKGIFNGKLYKVRNEAMQECIEKEKPEVCVVGWGHVKYLKEKSPGSYFSCFVEKSIVSRLVPGLLKKRINADKTYFVPLAPFIPDPKNLLAYGDKFIAFAANGAVAAGIYKCLTHFNMPLCAEFPLLALSGYFAGRALADSREAYYFLKTLKEVLGVGK